LILLDKLVSSTLVEKVNLKFVTIYHSVGLTLTIKTKKDRLHFTTQLKKEKKESANSL